MPGRARPPVVALAPGEDGLLALHHRGEDVGAGAHRELAAGAEGVRMLRERPGRVEAEVGPADRVQELRVRPAQRDLDPAGVQHRARLVRPDQRLGVPGLRLGRDHPVEVRLDRVRVERGAVTEGHVLAQYERVGQPVVRHRPGRRQPRQIPAVRRLGNQRVEHRAQDQAEHVLGADLRVPADR